MGLQRQSVPMQKRTNVTPVRPVAVQTLFNCFVSRLLEITLALFIKEKPKLTCTSYNPRRNNRAT